MKTLKSRSSVSTGLRSSLSNTSRAAYANSDGPFKVVVVFAFSDPLPLGPRCLHTASVVDKIFLRLRRRFDNGIVPHFFDSHCPNCVVNLRLDRAIQLTERKKQIGRPLKAGDDKSLVFTTAPRPLPEKICTRHRHGNADKSETCE